jgi:Xaa-Pro dipeptidase
LSLKHEPWDTRELFECAASTRSLYFGHIMAGESASAVSFFDGPTGGNGLNPSYPQGAGMTEVKNNEPVLVDFVSVYEGYMVDQTRIFCLGEPPLHLLEAYNRAVEIKHTLAKEGKPGVLGSDLYLLSRKIAAKPGWPIILWVIRKK